MKSVYIDDDLHRKAKIHTAQEGTTLRALVEGHIRQGLGRGPAMSAAGAVAEPVISYELEPPSVAAAPTPSGPSDPLAEIEAQGHVIRGEPWQRKIAEVIGRVYEQLGLEPPQGLPPTVQEVREILARHQREHPEVPTVSQLVLDMREEY